MKQAELRLAIISHRQGNTPAADLQKAVSSFVGTGKNAVANTKRASRMLRLLNNGNNVKLRRYLAATDNVVQGAGSDDISPLTSVVGIGAVTASKLAAAGISSIVALANYSAVDLADLLTTQGIRANAGTLIQAAIEALGAESDDPEPLPIVEATEPLGE
jgi:predicted flap endonuclease-1-like 5' DNA nuclease